MDQQNHNFEEQSRAARESTRRLKRNMIIVIVCLVAFAVVAIPLINVLDNLQNGGTVEETQKLPPSSIIFATPDYDYDIMQDEDYLQLNRRIYHCDERSGLTEELTDKNVAGYGEAARVLREAVPLVVGEALDLAVAVVGVGEPTELVVLARNAPVFAAVPCRDDLLDEP